MRRCREIDGADPGLARRLTRCSNFDLDIVSEALCIGGPTSGDHHGSTTTTHRYVKADLAMTEKALARLEALCAK